MALYKNGISYTGKVTSLYWIRAPKLKVMCRQNIFWAGEITFLIIDVQDPDYPKEITVKPLI